MIDDLANSDLFLGPNFPQAWAAAACRRQALAVAATPASSAKPNGLLVAPSTLDAG